MEGISIDFANISENDLILAFMGYVVVFSALVVLYLIFNNLPKILEVILNKRTILKIKIRKADGLEENVTVPGEVNAAIAAGLFHYFNELHDEEATKLTINKVSKNYSPWSSKIYGVMNQPQR